MISTLTSSVMRTDFCLHEEQSGEIMADFCFSPAPASRPPGESTTSQVSRGSGGPTVDEGLLVLFRSCSLKGNSVRERKFSPRPRDEKEVVDIVILSEVVLGNKDECEEYGDPLLVEGFAERVRS